MCWRDSGSRLKSSSLDKVPRQEAEVRLTQGLQRLPEPRDQRRRRVKLPRGVDVHRCDDLRCSDARVYVVGRLGVRRGTLELVVWTDV